MVACVKAFSVSWCETAPSADLGVAHIQLRTLKFEVEKGSQNACIRGGHAYTHRSPRTLA